MQTSRRRNANAAHTKRPLALQITATLGSKYIAALEENLLAAHRILKPSLTELSVALVNDTKMSALHEQFLNISGPTDVLTFPLDLDRKGHVLSGEVVVCVPEAQRRAKEQGIAVASELLLYALHGMLHLCGFDDRTDRGYRRMHEMEDTILKRLGIGPVFAFEAPAKGGRR